MASAAADLATGERGQRVRCTQCGAVLEDRGLQERRLTTHHDQVVRLERSYGVCPVCGVGFFPPG
jgi:uncharacterized protein with PIN domain